MYLCVVIYKQNSHNCEKQISLRSSNDDGNNSSIQLNSILIYLCASLTAQ
jgi:hypothetical protein